MFRSSYCSHLPSKSVYVGARWYQLYDNKPGRRANMICPAENKFVWYPLVFDDDKPGREGCTPPILRPTEPIPWLKNAVVVDSTIYSLGCYYQRFSNKVFCLDTSDPKRSTYWVEGPLMNVCRRCPVAVVLHKKIYVFGGNSDDCTSWAEVLDLTPAGSGKWVPLLPPPTSFRPTFATAVLPADEIVVGSVWDKIVYAYHVETKHWEEVVVEPRRNWIDKSIQIFPWDLGICTPVAVDTALFWLSGNQLFAYDIVDNWYASGSILSVMEAVRSSCCEDDPTSLLLLVDDKLCLVASSFGSPLLHCKFLGVTINLRLESLDIVVDCSHTFEMEAGFFSIRYAVSVDRAVSAPDTVGPLQVVGIGTEVSDASPLQKRKSLEVGESGTGVSPPRKAKRLKFCDNGWEKSAQRNGFSVLDECFKNTP